MDINLLNGVTVFLLGVAVFRLNRRVTALEKESKPSTVDPEENSHG